MAEQDRLQFEEIFEERDISEEHWPGLIETIASGELLAADSGAEPVSVETVEREGELVDRLEFADHSVAFQTITGTFPDASVDGEESLISPMGVGTSGCLTKVSPAFWTTVTGCRAHYDWISFSYRFYVSFKVRSGYNIADY